MFPPATRRCCESGGVSPETANESMERLSILSATLGGLPNPRALRINRSHPATLARVAGLIASTLSTVVYVNNRLMEYITNVNFVKKINTRNTQDAMP